MSEDRFEEMMAQRGKMLETHGWVVDVVSDTKDSKCASGTGRDIHTHGIEESFDHPDLQCVLPVDPKMVHGIFAIIVEMIKKGRKFEAGKCYSDILPNKYKLRFLEAEENDRKVLRVILPDKEGKLHKELMQEDFRIQFNGI